MGAIFISYRRSDTSGYAGRLQDRLSAHFGHDQVFRDIDALQPGVDFVDAVDSAIRASSAVIVLIGRRWLSDPGASGRLRLQDVDDYPRMEITAALEQRVLILPVLVDGATMPDPEQLPEAIRRLGRINALELSDTRWDYDVDRLIHRLEPAMASEAVVPPPPSAPVPPPARPAPST
ncbi:MAG: hypothetical protein QOE92_621, partial [Chloroflexota bacterium]|nr:hypothetical protein [Chloroflexota bacterium]